MGSQLQIPSFYPKFFRGLQTKQKAKIQNQGVHKVKDIVQKIFLPIPFPNFFTQKLFQTKHYFWKRNFVWDQKLFEPKNSRIKFFFRPKNIFRPNIFCTKIFFDQHFSSNPLIFWDPTFFGSKVFSGHSIFFYPIFFGIQRKYSDQTKDF